MIGELTRKQTKLLLYLSEQPGRIGNASRFGDGQIISGLAKKNLVRKAGRDGAVQTWQAVESYSPSDILFMKEIVIRAEAKLVEKGE